MNRTSIINIVKNIFNPKYTKEILHKVIKRFEKNTASEATKWAKLYSQSIHSYCSQSDKELWGRIQRQCEGLKSDAQQILSNIGISSLGGGGAYPLLYFLISKYKPEIVVETGVAAGWSSRAILEAVKCNGKGRLFSSDFPYFRLSKPEQYIGVVVPKSSDIRENWSLDVRGDRVAIPEIYKSVQQIDFFHYDSDKSYDGRRFVYKTLKSKFNQNCIIIMDDIQDNLFFNELVDQEKLDVKIFVFEDKFIGAIGL
jgi:hypothetical protein